MAEIILGIVIIFLLGYIVYLNERHSSVTSELMSRIMAKNLLEFKESTVPVTLPEPSTKIPDEFVPVQSLDDDEWGKMIAQQAGTETVKEKALNKLKLIARK